MANTRFKVDNGLSVSGNTEFYHTVNTYANAHFFNDVFVVTGNLTIGGTLTYSNVAIAEGGVIPTVDQQPLGNNTNRFNTFLYEARVDSYLYPGANNVPLGNTTSRFNAFVTNVSASGTISVGNSTVNSTVNSTSFSGTANVANNLVGLSSNGYVVRNGTNWLARTLESNTNSLIITNGNGVSGNTVISINFDSGFLSNTSGVYVNASAIAIGTLPISRGGTGAGTSGDALNNLLPSQTGNSGKYFTTNGTNPSWTDAIGYTGSQGAQGSLGFTGSRGDIGFTGSRGATGFVGSAGSDGIDGALGYTGSQGNLGYTGSQGDTGDTGEIGYTGSRGAAGSNGSNGSQGYTGSRGATGSAGSNGSTGYTGSRGFTGSKGDLGYTGSSASAANPILRHVTTGYTGGGQVFVTTGSSPSSPQNGDIWIII